MSRRKVERLENKAIFPLFLLFFPKTPPPFLTFRSTRSILIKPGEFLGEVLSRFARPGLLWHLLPSILLLVQIPDVPISRRFRDECHVTSRDRAGNPHRRTLPSDYCVIIYVVIHASNRVAVHTGTGFYPIDFATPYDAVIGLQMRDQVLFSKELSIAVFSRASKHFSHFRMRLEMSFDAIRFHAFPAFLASLPAFVSLLEVFLRFETGFEDGFALRMKLASVQTMALLDVAPQVAPVQERPVAFALLAFERQDAGVVVSVGLQLPVLLEGLVAGRAGISFEGRWIEVRILVGFFVVVVVVVVGAIGIPFPFGL